MMSKVPMYIISYADFEINTMINPEAIVGNNFLILAPETSPLSTRNNKKLIMDMVSLSAQEAEFVK